MRTKKDRIRYALSFEIIGLLIYAPLSSFVFGYELKSMGVITLAGSIVATIWNYFYNLLFDKTLLRLKGSVHKSIMIRVSHAVLFEGGLLLLFIPIVSWYLNISLWEAFIIDIAMSTFYLIYTFVFTIIYDKVYPVAD